MKRILFTIALFSSAAFAVGYFPTQGPNGAQMMGNPLAVGEQMGLSANGDVCNPQVNPVYQPLNQGMYPQVNNQYMQPGSVHQIPFQR